MEARVGTILVGLVAATLLATSASAALAVAPDLEAALGSPGNRSEAIDADIDFREALHFKSGRNYVEGLYDDVGRTVGTRAFGALFTSDELSELRARDSLNRDTTIIHTYYQNHPAKRSDFGGLMIDHAAGGVLAVYLKEDATTPWRGDLHHPQRLEIRRVGTSLEQLEAIREEIFRVAAAGGAATADLVEIAVDVERNKVGVGFRPRALDGLDNGEPPAAFKQRFGKQHIHAYPQVPPTFAAAVKGGWSYSPGGCTFGLKVDKPTASDPDDRFFITAGHDPCMYPVPPVQLKYHNGNPVGHGFARKFHAESEVDAALVRVDADYSYTAAAKVVHKVSGVGYVLDVKAKVESHDKGKARCMTGISTGTRCGTIEKNNADIFLIPPNNFWLRNLVKVEHLLRHKGDSGGPAYWHNTEANVVKAAGILSSADADTDPRNPRAWYTKIGRIEALDWNVSLATLPGSEGCKIPGFGGPGANCPIDGGGDY